MDQTQPAPDTDDYTPTVKDLREIADFLFARSLDEASAAGVMSSYRKSGVTLEVRIPEGAFAKVSEGEILRKTQDWLGAHSPDRFVALASELAQLGYALSGAGISAVHEAEYAPHVGPYRAQGVWRSLTSAARLWEQHPDFKPLWAEKGESAG